VKLPRPPATVIFDLDGLLFDTEAVYEEAILAAARDAGHVMTPAIFRRMMGTTWLLNRAYLLAHYGAGFPVEEFRAAWMAHFNRMIETRLALKPGVLELLDALDRLGLPQAIATSNSHSGVLRHLTAHNLVDRFPTIVAHGDYVNAKPAPDPFLKAAEHLKVGPRLCIALEDSYNGIRSASSAGMMAIMVPDLLEPTDEVRELCTLVVQDLHAVRGLLT
jgi:HAD superfamily hydrolase (TIGR01509 family)